MNNHKEPWPIISTPPGRRSPKHLRILTECGAVRQKHRGREIFYQLENEKMKEIDQWLAQFRENWEDRFGKLDRLLAGMLMADDKSQDV